MFDTFDFLFVELYDGFHFFAAAFSWLFTDDFFSFIPWFMIIFAAYGSLTALLGIIGSGIAHTSRSLRNPKSR